MAVIDTDILVDYFRGLEEAARYLENLPSTSRRVTHITVMELYKGAANRRELRQIKAFLTGNGFVGLPITAEASQLAVQLVEQYGPGHGLTIPDALVAAICLVNGEQLVTGNARHFRYIPGLTAAPPPYRQGSQSSAPRATSEPDVPS